MDRNGGKKREKWKISKCPCSVCFCLFLSVSACFCLFLPVSVCFCLSRVLVFLCLCSVGKSAVVSVLYLPYKVTAQNSVSIADVAQARRHLSGCLTCSEQRGALQERAHTRSFSVPRHTPAHRCTLNTLNTLNTAPRRCLESLGTYHRRTLPEALAQTPNA